VTAGDAWKEPACLTPSDTSYPFAIPPPESRDADHGVGITPVQMGKVRYNWRLIGSYMVMGRMAARIALEMDPPRSGPRPLNPVRDLGAVADLLELVFRRELDATGRRLIREARMISRAGPLVYLLTYLLGTSPGLSPGFVWDEDGRLVGNVTLLRSRNRPGAWRMANVAVHPDYRRRGIATRLLNATTQHILHLEGRSINLQVREDSPAMMLYRRFGFQSLGAVTVWQLDSRLRLDQILASGRPLSKAQKSHWALIWGMFSSVTRAAQGWPDQLSEEDFRPSIRRCVADIVMGRSVHRWVAPGATAAVLDGYVQLETAPGSRSRLTLRVRPEASGELEGDLLLMALRQMVRRGFTRAVIEHPAGDVAAEGRLREAGFRPYRTLVLMRLEIEQHGDT